MQEVILHIGMPKTGSTAIQGSLANFDDGRVRFSQLGPRNHTGRLATIFFERPERHHSNKKKGLSASALKGISQKLRGRLEEELALDRQKLILSGEGICNFEKPVVSRIRDFFQERSATTTVLAYIRDPVSLASSSFQQKVKRGLGEPEMAGPDYRSRFEKFVEVFGRENVRLVKFDRKAFTNGSVVSDFCERIGVPDLGSESQTVNESLSGTATKFMYLFNRYGAPCKGNRQELSAHRQLVEFLRVVFPEGRFTLPPEYIYQSLDLKDIEWMETVGGLELLGEIPDFETSETSLGAFMEAVDEASILRLEGSLKEKGIRISSEDDPAAMLSRLFYSNLVGNKIDDSYADSIREIAIKIEEKQELTLKDAETILRLALEVRPKGPNIIQKIRKYEKENSG